MRYTTIHRERWGLFVITSIIAITVMNIVIIIIYHHHIVMVLHHLCVD